MSHKFSRTRDRSIPRHLAKMSFGEIPDITSDVFSFGKIYILSWDNGGSSTSCVCVRVCEK